MLPEIKTVLTIIGAVLTLVNYIPYLINIYRRKTRPHVFSWVLWFFLTGIAAAGQYAGGGGWGAFLTGFSALTCSVIALAALRTGEKQITHSDWICFLVGLAAIPLWLVTKTPLYSMILITLIDALAYYPTWRKSWDKPWEETLVSYALSGTKFLLIVAVLDQYNLVTVLYPASLVVMIYGFVLYVLWRRRVVKA